MTTQGCDEHDNLSASPRTDRGADRSSNNRTQTHRRGPPNARGPSISLCHRATSTSTGQAAAELTRPTTSTTAAVLVVAVTRPQQDGDFVVE